MQAWEAYDEWLQHGQAIFVEEPSSIDHTFRRLTRSELAAPKDWADSYLSAFAQTSGFQLVTFDQELGQKTNGAILLSS